MKQQYQFPSCLIGANIFLVIIYVFCMSFVESYKVNISLQEKLQFSQDYWGHFAMQVLQSQMVIGDKIATKLFRCPIWHQLFWREKHRQTIAKWSLNYLNRSQDGSSQNRRSFGFPMTSSVINVVSPPTFSDGIFTSQIRR